MHVLEIKPPGFFKQTSGIYVRSSKLRFKRNHEANCNYLTFVFVRKHLGISKTDFFFIFKVLQITCLQFLHDSVNSTIIVILKVMKNPVFLFKIL